MATSPALSAASFVGRDHEIAQLEEKLERAIGGQGSIVLIEGEAGIGKSFLLTQFQARAITANALSRARFVIARCYQDTSAQDAYGPFKEALVALAKRAKQHPEHRTMLPKLLKEAAPEWLKIVPEILPFLMPHAVVFGAIGLVAKTVGMGMEWQRDANDAQRTANVLAAQYVDALAKIATVEQPLALIIEDAHWIDNASCGLLQRLADRVANLALLVVVTYRPEDIVAAEHPFRRVRSEMIKCAQCERVRLDGLTEANVADYLQYRFGRILDARLAGWLFQRCGGHPFFLSQYLSLLEQERIIELKGGGFILDGQIEVVAGESKPTGRLASLPVPDSIIEVLRSRIDRLAEEDAKMLKLGAVQGDQFLSAIVADMLNKDQDTVLTELQRVIETHHVIECSKREVPLEVSETYQFEHVLMREALYNKWSDRQRLFHHRDIARYLEQLVVSPIPSRKLRLAIALHYDRGEQALEAATHYHQVAQSLMEEGANVEAIDVNRQALRNIRSVVGQNDRLHAEIISLILRAGERRRETLGLELELAEEGENAAIRSGDPGLIAKAHYLRGSVLGESKGLAACLPVMKEALELIRGAGDPVGEFMIMSELGHQLRGQDFTAGYRMQREAYTFFKDRLAHQEDGPINALRRQFCTVETTLGVAEFDCGQFGEALELLDRALRETRECKLRDEIPEVMNYLAQVCIAIGSFERAEKLLQEALDMVAQDDEPHSWNGTNWSLLGKLYVEWERFADAEEPMLRAWKESQTLRLEWSLPLTTNYYAELLMEQRYAGHDNARAAELLLKNVDATRNSGHLRSCVAALSLLARVASSRRESGQALDYSRQAMDILENVGTLPALRTEEVLFHHFRMLTNVGRREDARPYLLRAREVLDAKAASLGSEGDRQSFLERVPLSRQIRSASTD